MQDAADDRRYWTLTLRPRGSEARTFEWSGLAEGGDEAVALAESACLVAWAAAMAAVGRPGRPMPAKLAARREWADFAPAQSGRHASDEIWTLGAPFARAVDAQGTGPAAYDGDRAEAFQGLVEGDPFLRADVDGRVPIDASIALNMQGVRNADHLRLALIRKENKHDGCALAGKATSRAALALLTEAWATGTRGLYKVVHKHQLRQTGSATIRAVMATNAAGWRAETIAPAVKRLEAMGLGQIAGELIVQAKAGTT